ncbi:hypothetical protein CLAFUW4_08972 [Fulvia fulva]|nr:hypothetical protein CLAFUR4_08978 [Fulvia fulva]KAK4614342.1 hypothetical protein CLAFUR0_08970 [Fulvia fulva]WPV20160.1 hypothetical protein CLAFUW4_08972 [Fulvia fulva]WPV35224.1 hypothetical protein CLAFUW7_08973 [Fulvia fulva]
MTTANMASPLPPKLSAKLRESQRELLREEYPYLSQTALDQILNDSMAVVHNGIAKQSPSMAASKARSNFFTLPAELRNTIYELALAPQLGDNWIAREMDRSFGIMRCDPNGKKPGRFPPLLSASQQVREEALSVYWDLNTTALQLEAVYDFPPDGGVPIVNVEIKYEDKIRLLELLGPKQCALMGRVVLLYVKDGSGISMPFTANQIFLKLQLARLGLREEAVVLEQRDSWWE